jgi:GAF domain-containing protein
MSQQPTGIIAAFAELGRIKLGETDLTGVLDRVATLARHTIPGAGEVSITLVPDRGPYTAASTGELALRLDEWQYELGEGPCLTAAAEESTVSVPDLSADTRWPDWADRARTTGAGSSLSVGLPILDDVKGALNLYGDHPAAFDEDAITRAQTFAGHAGIALANAHLYAATANTAQHMQAAMESRAVIEQAKGIIMGERRCTADEAFTILTKVSQDSNRKLRDVAAALVARAQRRR